MLDGTVCAGCGVYLEGDADGYPRYCSAECEPVDIPSRLAPKPQKTTPYLDGRTVTLTLPALAKMNCWICGKKVSAIGLRDHQFSVHQVRA